MISRRTAALVLCVLVVPVFFLSASDRDLFDEAQRRFAAGNYALAVERFERLLQDYPESRYRTEAELRIAQSSFYLGEYADALERLQRIAVRARGGALAPTVQLWIGLTAYQLEDPVTAEAALSRHIAEADPAQGRAWLYRGLARADQGRIAEARADLRVALDRTDGSEQSYAAAVLMELATRAGDDAAVLEVYDRLPVVVPTERYAEIRVRYAADAARRQGNAEQAVQLYRDLTGYSIASAQWAYRQLYAVARDRQDRGAMQEIYREAERRLAAEPERLADFWFALGADALERGRFELAELYLSRLWDVRSERTVDGTAALYLARTIEAQERPGEAVSLLLESLDDDAVSDDALAERIAMAARLLAADGAPGEAATLLEDRGAVTDSAGTLYTWAYSRYAAGGGGTVLDRLSREDVQPLLREYPPLLRLRARLQLEAGDPAEAVRTYRVYLAERPDDVDARTELVRALTAARQFPAAEQEIGRILDDASVRTGLSDTRREELRFLGAIAAFNRGDFAGAASALQSVRDASFEPSRSYHLAWSLYRTGDVAGARQTIAGVVDSLPPALAGDGRYLYAWTLYRGGDTADARGQLLQILGMSLGTSEEVRTRRLLATVYLEDGRYDDALVQYRALVDLATTDGDRAAALQLMATTLVSANRTEEAVRQYDEIADRFPGTSVGRQALLEAGELLYGIGSLRQSRDRFRDYQNRYPDGPELDRALYWAGLTSSELGEDGRALLWWEPLVNQYPRSEYTPEVLFRTAAIYSDRDQRRQALALYDRLVAAYPDSPRASEAERRRRALRLELDGLSSREADLWVQLEPGSGDGPEAGSDRWFRLVLELGRIAIREQITLTRERARIVDKLLEATQFDGPDAAEASLLLAEYYRRRGETNAAVDRYAEAAATPGAPDELRAQSLFELAALARESGDTATARQALDQLQSRYGGSIWADRAGRLMESN